MSSNYTGLSDNEVIASREKYGQNILTPVKKESMWKKFLNKFRDPLMIILLVAGFLSLLISIYEYYSIPNTTAGVFFEPLGIFMAVILASGLAFVFENKAEKEFSILNQVNDDEPVEVIRSGVATMIPRKEVVVGDIVVIETGNEIPADGQLLEAVSLTVDESTLTGEPIAHKTTDPTHFDPNATFESNKVMRGTRVMEGHGVMRVEAVGDHTENGKVFVSAQIDNGVKSPLDLQLERLGGVIAKVAYICAIIIVVGRLGVYFATVNFEWLSFITNLLQSVMVAVALIVVSVPEGLPMAVTLSLAYSMRRMLKTNNLVRKLHACETMGAITVICTDKTGTLTQNRMQVYKTEFFGHPSDDIINYGIALNSTARLGSDNDQALGNPTEGALLLWLRSRGIDYEQLRANGHVDAELPFSTERKYMATVASIGNDPQQYLFVKGAPEIVFELCSDQSGLTRAEVDAQLLEYQNMAMRTIGFAFAAINLGDQPINDGKLTATDLHFIGIAAISDPVREDVPQAVADVMNAGIKIKMVTGDTPATAKEIARRIGLWDDAVDSDNNIAYGTDIESMTDTELEQRIENLKIIARARPMDKRRLVEALERRGNVVAVTGDGTNDAPALKAAHVGLSMGNGTSVAKEASDITIIDNSFASISRAVMWGRSLYKNIQRFILFQMTVNVVATLIVLIGAFTGLQSPLSVTQMLWVNLIMDSFAAVALASLPPSESVMKEKPRRQRDFIITGLMWKNIIGVGLAFVIALLGLLYYFHRCDGDILTPYDLTAFFTTFVFMQFWNMFNTRAFATGHSALDLRGCDGFLLIAAVILIGQVVIVEIGGNFFNVVPLRFSTWALIIGATSLVLWIGEGIRLVRSKDK